MYSITNDSYFLSYESLNGVNVKTGNILKMREQEHEELQFESFSNSLALKIGLRIVEKAEAEKESITVDIRKHGQQIFHFACKGTSADNDDWIIRKNRVADRFGKSSIYMKEFLQEKGVSLEELFFLDSRDYASFGGAFPIIIRNTGMIGTVTVSGLPDEKDHELVVSVIREFIQTGVIPADKT